jgi:hypothetical protein
MTKAKFNLILLARTIMKWPARYWQRGKWQKIVISFWSLLLLTGSVMYGISTWYAWSVRDKPSVMGTSFVPHYAESLGLDAQETMDSLINIGVRDFRLVSYWNDIERQQGSYDFSRLDWQFKKAEAAKADVSLSIGLRQPRWPECHTPDWAKDKPQSEWQPQLEHFIAAVVTRYEDSPSLKSYQLENEYFLKGFGECSNYDRGRLISEYNLVKRLDSKHPIILSRSNNAQGIPINEPKPDVYAISIYKRVWDAGLTKRYLEYPFPAWYYGFLAGWQKIHDGREMIIHELQAEAWAPEYKTIAQISLEEQNKSLNAERLEGRFRYGEATGMREMYLWGSEYWYYRYKVLHDPSLWDVAKKEFSGQTDR